MLHSAGYNNLPLHVVSEDGNEDICGACKRGGTLICCERCPAAYHPECAGYASSQDVPGGEESPWLCWSCVKNSKGRFLHPKTAVQVTVGQEIFLAREHSPFFFKATVTGVKQDSIEIEYQTARKEPETVLKTSARIWRGTHDPSAWTAVKKDEWQPNSRLYTVNPDRVARLTSASDMEGGMALLRGVSAGGSLRPAGPSPPRGDGAPCRDSGTSTMPGLGISPHQALIPSLAVTAMQRSSSPAEGGKDQAGPKLQEPEVLESEAEFMAAWQQYAMTKHRKSNMPRIYHKIPSAHKFWQEVMAYGGYEVVSERKLWATIARVFGAPESMTDRSHVFKKNYADSLLEFEQATRRGETGVQIPRVTRTAPTGGGTSPTQTLTEKRPTGVGKSKPLASRSSKSKRKVEDGISFGVSSTDDGSESLSRSSEDVARVVGIVTAEPAATPRPGDAVEVRARQGNYLGGFYRARVDQVVSGGRFEGGLQFWVSLDDYCGADGLPAREVVPLIHPDANAAWPAVCIRHRRQPERPPTSSHEFVEGMRVEGYDAEKMSWWPATFVRGSLGMGVLEVDPSPALPQGERWTLALDHIRPAAPDEATGYGLLKPFQAPSLTQDQWLANLKWKKHRIHEFDVEGYATRDHLPNTNVEAHTPCVLHIASSGHPLHQNGIELARISDGQTNVMKASMGIPRVSSCAAEELLEQLSRMSAMTKRQDASGVRTITGMRLPPVDLQREAASWRGTTPDQAPGLPNMPASALRLAKGSLGMDPHEAHVHLTAIREAVVSINANKGGSGPKLPASKSKPGNAVPLGSPLPSETASGISCGALGTSLLLKSSVSELRKANGLKEPESLSPRTSVSEQGPSWESSRVQLSPRCFPNLAGRIDSTPSVGHIGEHQSWDSLGTPNQLTPRVLSAAIPEVEEQVPYNLSTALAAAALKSRQSLGVPVQPSSSKVAQDFEGSTAPWASIGYAVPEQEMPMRSFHDVMFGEQDMASGAHETGISVRPPKLDDTRDTDPDSEEEDPVWSLANRGLRQCISWDAADQVEPRLPELNAGARGPLREILSMPAVGPSYLEQHPEFSADPHHRVSPTRGAPPVLARRTELVRALLRQKILCQQGPGDRLSLLEKVNNTIGIGGIMPGISAPGGANDITNPRYGTLQRLRGGRPPTPLGSMASSSTDQSGVFTEFATAECGTTPAGGSHACGLWGSPSARPASAETWQSPQSGDLGPLVRGAPQGLVHVGRWGPDLQGQSAAEFSAARSGIALRQPLVPLGLGPSGGDHDRVERELVGFNNDCAAADFMLESTVASDAMKLLARVEAAAGHKLEDFARHSALNADAGETSTLPATPSLEACEVKKDPEDWGKSYAALAK
eukprot:jgi/Botrbrau1/9836/Bobra.0313s0013.2